MTNTTKANAEAPMLEPIVVDAADPYTFLRRLREFFLQGYQFDPQHPFQLSHAFNFALLVDARTEGLPQ